MGDVACQNQSNNFIEGALICRNDRAALGGSLLLRGSRRQSPAGRRKLVDEAFFARESRNARREIEDANNHQCEMDKANQRKGEVIRRHVREHACHDQNEHDGDRMHHRGFLLNNFDSGSFRPGKSAY